MPRSENSGSAIPWTRRVEYASGYIELGLIQQASDELEAIDGNDRMRPQVLLTRCDLYFAAKWWGMLIEAAKGLVRMVPDAPQPWIHWAYALREKERIEEARAVLLEAEKHHPEEGNLHYNLACYFCLLGDMDEAKKRLKQAIRIEPLWKQASVDDPDLRRLWDHFAAS